MNYKNFFSTLNSLDAESDHVSIRDTLHHIEESSKYDQIIQELRSAKERFTDKRLHTDAGFALDNPLIVGAGWDKPAHAVKALFDLGFGGVEIGSVMQYPQDGNSRPRHFWLANGVSLNRYGFNSPGMEITADNLNRYENMNIPIGVNIGKNKSISDEQAPTTYASVAHRLWEYATYFVINVSSPNTPGLRVLQDKKPLTDIVEEVKKALAEAGGQKPLFVKIAPDLTVEAVDEVIDVVITNNLTGIVATNTTNSVEIKEKYGVKDEMGGVSGDDADFRKMSTEIVSYIYKQAGRKIKIIGAGGIKDAKTALEKIRMGAHAIEIVTALDQEGPQLPGKINQGIAEYLEKEGVQQLSELVGIDVR